MKHVPTAGVRSVPTLKLNTTNPLVDGYAKYPVAPYVPQRSGVFLCEVIHG